MSFYTSLANLSMRDQRVRSNLFYCRKDCFVFAVNGVFRINYVLSDVYHEKNKYPKLTIPDLGW